MICPVGRNGGGKCYGVTTMASTTVAMSLLGETKGACRNVNTPTVNWLLKLIKSV